MHKIIHLIFFAIKLKTELRLHPETIPAAKTITLFQSK